MQPGLPPREGDLKGEELLSNEPNAQEIPSLNSA